MPFQFLDVRAIASARGGRPDQLTKHQRSRRAGDHALAAGDTAGRPHRIIQIKTDVRGIALARTPDDVVFLDLVAGPHAAVAEDALVVIHGDPGGAVVTATVERPPAEELPTGQRPLRLDHGRVDRRVGGRLNRPRIEGEFIKLLDKPSEFVGRQARLPIGRQVIGGEQVDERPHVCIDPLPCRQVGGANRLHLHRLLDAVVAGGE